MMLAAVSSLRSASYDWGTGRRYSVGKYASPRSGVPSSPISGKSPPSPPFEKVGEHRAVSASDAGGTTDGFTDTIRCFVDIR